MVSTRRQVKRRQVTRRWLAPRGVTRRGVTPAGWWVDALLIAGFVAITALLAVGDLLGIDLAVRDWCDTHRPAVPYWIARVGNYLGQGGYLFEGTGLLALVLAWRRRSVRPVLPVLVGLALTFGILTPLKVFTDRAAPHALIAQPELFGSGGRSYPSGHLVNAFVWYGVLALLLAPWLPTVWRRVIRIVPPAVVLVTTVYLGFHWLTDTVAGLLLGVFLDRLMHRVRWDAVPLPRRRAGGSAPVGKAALSDGGVASDGKTGSEDESKPSAGGAASAGESSAGRQQVQDVGHHAGHGPSGD